jgi:hypothetical protein
MISDNELEEILLRASRATPGPWFGHATDDFDWSNALYISTTQGLDLSTHDEKKGMSDGDPNQAPPSTVVAITLLQAPRLCLSDAFEENTEFIAHARSDIPRLIEEIKRLKSLIAEQGKSF